ncbi:MAG: hypothetical protein HY513_04080 [Candidatus Aenigmarchaeota archaeon]|nr:hypothetical protein [Candidatus Aenigmarchaeota archaeon]
MFYRSEKAAHQIFDSLGYETVLKIAFDVDYRTLEPNQIDAIARLIGLGLAESENDLIKFTRKGRLIYGPWAASMTGCWQEHTDEKLPK